MFLAHCLAVCEEELICDFAETYHILDIGALSPQKAAVLCVGLRDNSRVKMMLSEMKVPLDTLLLARIIDELSFQSWTKTKDGQKNRNRPQSVLKRLTEEPKEEIETYKTIDDFHKVWERINHA